MLDVRAILRLPMSLWERTAHRPELSTEYDSYIRLIGHSLKFICAQTLKGFFAFRVTVAGQVERPAL